MYEIMEDNWAAKREAEQARYEAIFDAQYDRFVNQVTGVEKISTTRRDYSNWDCRNPSTAMRLSTPADLISDAMDSKDFDVRVIQFFLDAVKAGNEKAKALLDEIAKVQAEFETEKAL